MLFLSLEFALFCCVIVGLYLFAPQRLRIPILLVASYVWYISGNGLYTFALLISTCIDFAIGKALASAKSPHGRHLLVLLSICFNLGLLALFKYFPAVSTDVVERLQEISRICLPGEISLLGISYFSFVKIAYIVDIYRGQVEPEHDFAMFATFVAIFPTISAGPIERADHLIPQLRKTFTFDEDRTIEGLRMILWGTFKKAVIAAQLAAYVDPVYEDPQTYSGVVLITATFFYAFQIYADFSGYTDIARGIARLLGMNLFENFRQPYLSQSVIEFWRRWHVSLTNWIRDYVFFPLSRFLLAKSNRRHQRLIEIFCYVLVMGLVGLWHDASATMIVWGLLHGLYMSAETLLNRKRAPNADQGRLLPLLRMGTTFALVSFAWIFFRAHSLADAAYIVTHLFDLSQGLSSLGQPVAEVHVSLWLSGLMVVILIAADGFEVRGTQIPLWRHRLAVISRWLIYYVALFCIYRALQFSAAPQQFIYFQF